MGTSGSHKCTSHRAKFGIFDLPIQYNTNPIYEKNIQTESNTDLDISFKPFNIS